MSKRSTFVSIINEIRLAEKGNTTVAFTVESPHELELSFYDISVFYFHCLSCPLDFSWDRELRKIIVNVHGEKHG